MAPCDAWYAQALVRHGCDERARDAAGRTGAQLAAERRAVQALARLAGPLAELRAARLAAKSARRKGERAKRQLLAHALRRALRGAGGGSVGGGSAGGGGAGGARGLFLEFGVASGGSINFLAARVPDGIGLDGFDSFEASNAPCAAPC